MKTKQIIILFALSFSIMVLGLYSCLMIKWHHIVEQSNLEAEKYVMDRFGVKIKADLRYKSSKLIFDDWDLFLHSNIILIQNIGSYGIIEKTSDYTSKVYGVQANYYIFYGQCGMGHGGTIIEEAVISENTGLSEDQAQ